MTMTHNPFQRQGIAFKMLQKIFSRAYSDKKNFGYRDNYDSSKEKTIDLFWNHFYNKLDESIKSKTIKYSNVSLYYHEVIKLLKDHKQQSLYSLQLEIENLTMNFDEKSVFKSYPNVIKLLVGKDMITAKEYLKQCDLSEIDMTTILVLGTYTLEAIMVHVLGSVFNPLEDFSTVRVSTLIEQIDSFVRVQAINMGIKITPKKKKQDQIKVSRSDYAIGVNLVEFLVNRNVITVKTDRSNMEEFTISKKGGYIPLHCYAMCNFDFNILPIKLNLPMVWKPLDWTSKVDSPSTLADIEGGYLSGLTGEIYNRFRLLRSHDYDNIYIKLKDSNRMCNVLNTLQSQVFKINKKKSILVHFSLS